MINNNDRSSTPPISMTEWATRLGRNDRWLEQKTIIAIRAYADNHRLMVSSDPEHRTEIEQQLAQTLDAQLSYATYLTEHSSVGP